VATWRSRVEVFTRMIPSAAAIVCTVVACAACTRSPAAPSIAGSLLGTWTGTITGEGVGDGALTLVVADERGVAPLTRVAGDWTAVFSDARFGGRGTFTGGANGASVLLDFSAMVVACPGQPRGTAVKSPIVTLQRSDRRMAGHYLVLDCLGGEMSVSRE
jgi:hypothetical protein